MHYGLKTHSAFFIYNNIMNDNSKTLLAFFAGLAVGATLGIILAPERGETLRNRLGDSLKRTGDDFLDKLSNALDNSPKTKPNIDEYQQQHQDGHAV